MFFAIDETRLRRYPKIAVHEDHIFMIDDQFGHRPA
jgi:hypothetical protein